MLVWDSFKSHITEDIKNQLKLCNTVMSVIPGGCTKYLQPLDVSINHSSKTFVNYICDFKKANSNTQPVEKAPSHLQQMKWVVEAWNKVLTDIIINSFDVCGITTNDATKILCLRNEQNDADDEEVTGNLNDIINDFDSSDDECVFTI